jgi:hypothetical protein
MSMSQAAWRCPKESGARRRLLPKKPDMIKSFQ